MDEAKLNNASMSDVISELHSGEPTNLELRAALMHAMRRIEELEKQIVELDDTLLLLYRRTPRTPVEDKAHDEPSAGTPGHLRLV